MSYHPRLSRRTTIAAAAVLGTAVAGCDIDPPSRDDTGAGTPPPPEDADLVAEVVSLIDAAEATASAAAQGSPTTAGITAPLALAHHTHRDLLAGALPTSEVTPAVPLTLPRAPRRALRHVRTRELQLQRRVEQACVEARSGDLARVLASVAASTSQYLLVIDRELGR